MTAASIAILVLLGALALCGGILGTWVWALYRRLDIEAQAGCYLRNEVARLNREREASGYAGLVEGMNGEDVLAEYHRNDPDLDDSDG